MNGCKAVQAKFTEYLDGRLNGREMQRIGSHLEACPECSMEWRTLQRTQSAIAGLGQLQAPRDLALRLRVAISQEQARARQGFFHGWDVIWRNSVAPFLLQASAGLASSVLLMGTVIFLVSMFAQPEMAQARSDEPLGYASAPKLLYMSNSSGDSDMKSLSGPVMVEAYVNGTGQVYDYRIMSGPDDARTRAQVEDLLLSSVFAPAKFFGKPVRGVAVVSFSGVSVRG